MSFKCNIPKCKEPLLDIINNKKSRFSSIAVFLKEGDMPFLNQSMPPRLTALEDITLYCSFIKNYMPVNAIDFYLNSLPLNHRLPQKLADNKER